MLSGSDVGTPVRHAPTGRRGRVSYPQGRPGTHTLVAFDSGGEAEVPDAELEALPRDPRDVTLRVDGTRVGIAGGADRIEGLYQFLRDQGLSCVLAPGGAAEEVIDFGAVTDDDLDRVRRVFDAWLRGHRT